MAVSEDQNAREEESYATRSPFFWSTSRKGLLTGGCCVGLDPLCHLIFSPCRTTMFRSGRISKQNRPLAERTSLTSVLIVLTRTYSGGEASSRASAASLTMCSSPSYTYFRHAIDRHGASFTCRRRRSRRRSRVGEISYAGKRSGGRKRKVDQAKQVVKLLLKWIA